jgi:hypothetical protein
MSGLRNNLHNVGIDRIPSGDLEKVEYANATLLHEHAQNSVFLLHINGHMRQSLHGLNQYKNRNVTCPLTIFMLGPRIMLAK